jgi:hypothetical protein
MVHVLGGEQLVRDIELAAVPDRLDRLAQHGFVHRAFET